MTDLRMAVIGLGAQGRTIATHLAKGAVDGARLAAVVSSQDPASLAELGVPVHPTDADLYRSGDADAVVVAVPHMQHPEFGERALEAGVGLLLEKPAGAYSAQVERLERTAREHPGVPFGLMFVMRSAPVYAEAKRRIAELGALRRVQWTVTSLWRPQGYYEQSKWRATWGGEGGGVLVNQVAHHLDLLGWLLGEPTSVVANVRHGFRREIAVEDEVVALFEYDGGASGVFVGSTHDLVGEDRLEIAGDNGVMVIENDARLTVHLFERPEQGISATVPNDLVRRVFTREVSLDSFYETSVLEAEPSLAEMTVATLANFVAHVREGEALVAPGLEGGRQVRMGNAIQLAGWTGERVALADPDLSARYLAELNARVREEGLFPELR